MNSLNTSIWRCRYLCRRTKLRIFKSLVLPVLLYGCEHGHLAVTWRGVSMSLVPNAFAGSWDTATITLYQISDCSMKLESSPVTSIVCEHKLWLYGHVARLPDVDPAHRVLSVKDNPALNRPRRRPRNSWLGKVDRSCRELLEMGRMVAWGLARRDHHGWRRRVSDATRSRHMLPIDDDDERS